VINTTLAALTMQLQQLTQLVANPTLLAIPNTPPLPVPSPPMSLSPADGDQREFDLETRVTTNKKGESFIMGKRVEYNPKETERVVITIESPLEVDLTVIGSLRRAFVSRRDTTALTWSSSLARRRYSRTT